MGNKISLISLLESLKRNWLISFVIIPLILIIVGIWYDKYHVDNVDEFNEMFKTPFTIEDIEIHSTDTLPELSIKIFNNKSRTLTYDTIIFEVIKRTYAAYMSSGFEVIPDKTYNVYLSDTMGKILHKVDRAIHQGDMDFVKVILNGDIDPQEGLNMFLFKVGIVKNGIEIYHDQPLLVNIANGGNALRSSHENMAVAETFARNIDSFFMKLPPNTRIEPRLLEKLNNERLSLLARKLQ